MTRILSGIQPTGEIHLGNYLGALRHWVAQQADAECLYLLADLHAITVPQDPGVLRSRTLHAAALLLAIGIDPGPSALFVQSHLSQHAELAWILSCLATFGELQRMTQFKEKVAPRDSATVGLFAYPALQAADILLYQADRVPVGADQTQHLELTRDLAQRFNRRFGDTFNLPQPLMGVVGSRIMDLQDPRKKMSKSSESPKGSISLLDTRDVIRDKIRSAVTDSGCEVRVSPDRPAISNLLTIYSLIAGTSIPSAEQEFSGKSYAQLKTALTNALVEFLHPIQDRYSRARSEPQRIREVLRSGAERARAVAARTLACAYERIGFLPR